MFPDVLLRAFNLAQLRELQLSNELQRTCETEAFFRAAAARSALAWQRYRCALETRK